MGYTTIIHKTQPTTTSLPLRCPFQPHPTLYSNSAWPITVGLLQFTVVCPSIPELEQVGDLELHEHGCPLRGKTSPAGSCRSSCKDPVSKFHVPMISKSVLDNMRDI